MYFHVTNHIYSHHHHQHQNGKPSKWINNLIECMYQLGTTESWIEREREREFICLQFYFFISKKKKCSFVHGCAIHCVEHTCENECDFPCSALIPLKQHQPITGDKMTKKISVQQRTTEKSF